MEEGGYMMASNFVGRMLHVTYPAIVFAIVMLIWSSSDLAEVARFAPPPVSDGFNFFWNPTVSEVHTCNGKQDFKTKFKQVCSTGSSNSRLEQFSNSSSQTTNQTN